MYSSVIFNAQFLCLCIYVSNIFILSEKCEKNNSLCDTILDCIHSVKKNILNVDMKYFIYMNIMKTNEYDQIVDSLKVIIIFLLTMNQFKTPVNPNLNGVSLIGKLTNFSCVPYHLVDEITSLKYKIHVNKCVNSSHTCTRNNFKTAQDLPYTLSHLVHQDTDSINFNDWHIKNTTIALGIQKLKISSSYIVHIFFVQATSTSMVTTTLKYLKRIDTYVNKSYVFVLLQNSLYQTLTSINNYLSRSINVIINVNMYLQLFLIVQKYFLFLIYIIVIHVTYLTKNSITTVIFICMLTRFQKPLNFWVFTVSKNRLLDKTIQRSKRIMIESFLIIGKVNSDLNDTFVYLNTIKLCYSCMRYIVLICKQTKFSSKRVNIIKPVIYVMLYCYNSNFLQIYFFIMIFLLLYCVFEKKKLTVHLTLCIYKHVNNVIRHVVLIIVSLTCTIKWVITLIMRTRIVQLYLMYKIEYSLGKNNE